MKSLLAGSCLAALLLFPVRAPAQTSFVAFESGPVRPMALSPDGSRLFVANAPDNRLEIFQVSGGALTALESVPVGMEPVAVAARTDGEVWVVNHLSDSVSVVDVSTSPARVVRTLLVDDEPRDVVFAGTSDTGGTHAFVTTARRGQHRTHPSIAGRPGAGDPQLTTPSVGRTEVWVFDTNDLDQGASDPTLGGVPERILTFFGDTPRALATDGSTVYVGVLNSGNQTTTVNEGTVPDGFESQDCIPASDCNGDGITSPNGLPLGRLPGGNPGPSDNHEGTTAPEVGLIVRFDAGSGQWQDERGFNWSNGVRFHLPDRDVFTVDASSLAPGPDFSGVGTTLFNMAVNPANGNVYVSNTDAKNLTRFEGPGAHGGSTVQGNLAQAQLTVITQPGGQVKPRHLNQHLDYAVLPAPAGKKDHSLATPLEMVVSSDGATLYVAAFGSQKVGVFATADLENDALFDGNPAPADLDPEVESANYISLSGGGPAGLVLDEANDRLYVYTRFDNSVAVVQASTGTELTTHALLDPEPTSLVEGRPFLYDALGTSSNGEASCASCHIFGDKDELAWDLGNPDDDVTRDPIPRTIPPVGDVNGGAAGDEFHPMKGPMTTQTLKGLSTHGAMHWRGDRADGFFGFDANPHAFDEDLSFRNFIVAFEGLVGGDVPATDPQLQADVQKFTDFALQMTLPPNPVRSLDNSLTTPEQNGRNRYFGAISDGVFNCDGCHTLSPAQGFFGTDGRSSFENETQIFKIAHLRNLYTKVGMFGMPDVPFIDAGNNGHQGDQIRGYGFLHDGSIDTIFRFFSATVFNLDQQPTGRSDMEAFMLAFDSDLAPIVGQQVTDDGTPDPNVAGRIALMKTRAAMAYPSLILGPGPNECDLIVKGTVGGVARGWLYDPGDDEYDTDAAADPPDSQADLDAIADAAGQALTYTCAPPGSGTRMGIDRDLDTILDADEGGPPSGMLLVEGKRLLVRDKDQDASKRKILLLSKDPAIESPTPGSAEDPTVNGATMTVWNEATPEQVTISLPAGRWTGLGNPAGIKGFKYVDKDQLFGPCKTALVKPGRLLKALCLGSAIGFSLDEPTQGALFGAIQMGSGRAHCMEFGSPRHDKPAEDGRVGVFLGKDTLAPASCTTP